MNKNKNNMAENEKNKTMTIEEQIAQYPSYDEQISFLKKKNIELPSWSDLDKVYDSEKHDVITNTEYQDIVKNGHTDKVSRITCDLPALAVKRMTEMMTGINIKRIYKPDDDSQKEVQTYLENIFARTRIDSVNIARLNNLFASCEVMTIWYAVETEEVNKAYGFDTNYKLRCRTFSPMNGDELYPKFDSTGDCVALSVYYEYKDGDKKYSYMDTYTATTHYHYEKGEGDWERTDEQITIGKIPAIYMYRPTPIWEHADRINTEIEWVYSRMGNYIRKNTKPMLAVYADESIPTERALPETSEFKEVVQLPSTSKMAYVTWDASVESNKFYIEQLKQSFWSQIQLPDWDYDNMKNNAMSGESRKQLFIDAQLKVKDESGRVLEFLDREINVVKAFLKEMQPQLSDAIDSLQVETLITPFTIYDERDTIDNITSAVGGGIASQREGIERLGWSDDPDRTLAEIKASEVGNAAEPYE